MLVKRQYNSAFKPIVFLLITVLLNASSCLGQDVTSQIIVNGVIYNQSNTDAVRGSGNSAVSRRDVGDFQRITHRIPAQVNYRHGKTLSVVVSGDDNILPFIMTSVNAGELMITARKSFVSQLPIVIEVSSPHLTAFSVHGSGNISATGIEGSRFKLDLNGSGSAVVTGKTDNLNISLSGSGDVDVKNLRCKLADVTIAGSGDITLTVAESLNARITGSGNIHYFGNPKAINKQILGSGGIGAGD